LVLVGLATVAGCGASAANPPAAPAGASASANPIVLTKDFGLWTMDETGANLKKLIEPIEKNLIRYPAWSPDGKSLVYSLFSPTGPRGLPEADLYQANADGGGRRLRVKHDLPGSVIQEADWSPDGKWLYFTYAGPLDKDNPLQGYRIEVQRVPLAGGPTETVVKDGSSPSLSTNGGRLAYVAPSPKTQEIVLFVSGAAGTNPKQLTKEGDFLLVYAPKVNPAGTQVVFAAAGAPRDQPPPPRATPSSRNPILDLLGVGIAEADGAPMDFWTIGVDGSGLKRLTNISEDSPYPAWSADGQRIAFFGIGGVYMMNADGSDLKKISDQVSHGEMDWYSR
jgi:Tol biopolymer transport system component